MTLTDLEMTINESINEAGENGVQECIPVPATVPPKCVHPFDCLCPPERVSLFFLINIIFQGILYYNNVFRIYE